MELNPLPDTELNLYWEVPDADATAALAGAIRELARAEGIEDAVLLVQLPSWGPVAAALRDELGWPVVYDCMDDWGEFPGIGRPLAAAERELVAGADAVTATAARLLERWAPLATEARLVRNGVDPAHYASPPAERPLADCPRPVIGFIGGIAAWVDLALVEHAARGRPDWTFVLVGEAFVDVSALEELPNVRLEGARPYEAMPAYVRDFDACLIPFVESELTAAVDPVKLYEYFALGKPVVTTPLPELDEHRDLVYEARGPDGFVAAVEAALAEDDPVLADRRRAVAGAASWEDRAASLRELLAELRAGGYRAVRRRTLRRALEGSGRVLVVGEPGRVAGIVALDPRLAAGEEGATDVLAAGLDRDTLDEAAAAAARLGRERFLALGPAPVAADGLTVLETRRLMWDRGGAPDAPGDPIDRDTRELLLSLSARGASDAHA